MIVRRIVSSIPGPCVSSGGVWVSPGNVLDVVVGGGVSALPSVGMFPARIEVDSAHMSAIAIANRFMDLAPLRLRRCLDSYINENGKAWNNKARLLARRARANYYPVCIRSTSR
jgi:hypothetical protein